MIKVIATIHNAEMAVNVGGSVESVSEIIEIPTKNIPPNLKKYIENRKNAKVTKSFTYEALSLSLLEEET